ncbi:MAG: serine hydrolase [Acidobacteria bacterium]|nr:serine hydrolase [Acidobacteriota bacterium]
MRRSELWPAGLAAAMLGVAGVAGCGTPPIDEATSLRAGFVAKNVCSGVFVGGRDEAGFLANDLTFVDLSDLAVGVDRASRRVSVTVAGDEGAAELVRLAIFHEGHGCTMLPLGQTDVLFDPAPVRSAFPGGTLLDWPMGDRLSDAPLPLDVDGDALEVAVASAFEDEDEDSAGTPLGTRAVAVVHRERLIAERYAEGFDQDSVMISWSMGKSITAALIGILVGDGHFSLDDPAPVLAWRQPGDPRAAITIRQLLRMSSGLEFSRLTGDDPEFYTHRNAHNYVYNEGIDVFAHAVRPVLEHSPGTVGRYRNADPLAIGKIIRDTVEARGEDYFTFPQRALFDRIGMRDMVLERDPYGNMILTGYDHGTARDWARFGLLHLRDGVWDGERILPEGWVDAVTTPAPAWPDQNYGGLFWLNRGGVWPDVPADAFWALGARGQHTVVIPSADLVVVRMGYSLDGAALSDNLNRVLAGILAAVGHPPVVPPPTDS